MLRNIILGVGVFAALFAILIFSGRIPIGQNNEKKPQGDVMLWGTVSADALNATIQQFNVQAKTYRVNYKQVKEDVFITTLVEALANGVGPDAILAPHGIILSQASRVYTFPLASFSEKKFKDTYVDGASVLFTPQGALALPVSVDPLVLFYNRRLFSQKGVVNPPQYWDEITTLVPALTQMDDKGKFIQSGIDLGSASTPYAKDILMSIVLQLGQLPTLRQYNPDGTPFISVTADTPTTPGGDVKPLTTVLRYFTQFSDPTKSSYTWNDFSGKPDEQFVAEKLAMYVGYASEFATLKARNQKADFEIAYLPQTRGYNTFATVGQLYGIATLKTSKNLFAALTVQSQFSGAGIAPAIAMTYGAVPALRSHATTAGVPEVIARSMLVATGWYDSFSNQSTTLAGTMIADVVNGRSGVSDAAGAFVARLQELYTPH